MAKLDEASSAPAEGAEKPKESRTGSLARKLAAAKRWISQNKKTTALGALCLILLAGFFIEPVKFAALNVVSDSDVDVLVVDNSTAQPLEKATVKLNGITAKTDKNGKLRLKGQAYGPLKYIVSKEGYRTASGSGKVTLGNNVIGPVKLVPTGVPIQIKATNKLSGDPVAKFRVGIEGTEVVAQSNSQGIAVLVVPPQKLGKVDINLSAEGFNTEKQTIDTSISKDSGVSLTLTPSGKHYFLSNRTGKVDVYSANLDGSQQTLVIEGKGNDDNAAQFVVAPDSKHAALVSKRDGQRGPDGSIVPALYMVDLAQKTIKRIDEGASSFTIRGWADNNRLAYTIVLGNYENPANFKVKTTDTAGNLDTLYKARAANAFFFPADPRHVYLALTDPTFEQYGLYSVDVGSKAVQKVHGGASYSLVQPKPYQLTFQVDNQKFILDTKTQKVSESADADTERNNYYIPSPDDQKLAWIEVRDGKGVILVGARDGSGEKALPTDVPATAVLRWIGGDYVIFRSASSSETAEYILAVGTGKVTKISGVYAPYFYY